jgi:hypothetical protein
VVGAVETATLYVYGVTWAGLPLGKVRGLADAPIEAIEHGELAAVTSVAAGDLRGKRRDLLRHSDVLQNVFDRAPVLPFRFGTVLESERAVVDDLLVGRYEELVALLQRFDGLGELRLRANFVEDAVLAEIVRDDSRIARLREETRKAPNGDPRRVQLGELVARSLEERRLAAADEIVASLVPHARDVQVDERREELEVIRASFLAERRAPRLERAAENLAARHAGRIAFELVGPMPPHSFVSLRGGGH